MGRWNAEYELGNVRPAPSHIPSSFVVAGAGFGSLEEKGFFKGSRAAQVNLPETESLNKVVQSCCVCPTVFPNLTGCTGIIQTAHPAPAAVRYKQLVSSCGWSFIHVCGCGVRTGTVSTECSPPNLGVCHTSYDNDKQQKLFLPNYRSNNTKKNSTFIMTI